ncbi:MAG: hypothetical protein LDL33_03510 [Desulfomonile sp.]|nr:hypothetical protein [Desulfomonile sp.]
MNSLNTTSENGFLACSSDSRSEHSEQSCGSSRGERGAALTTRLRIKTRLFIYGVVLAGWGALLAIGYVGYLHTIVHFRQQILAQEVRSLELALDSVIRERCLVVDAVVGGLEMDAFLKQNAMPNMIKRIRSAFPDFATVQVLDQQGTIVAMAGDVSLPDGTLPSIAKIEWPTDAGGLPGGWRFSDEPAANRWHLTCRHSTSRVGVWFVRATFSREPLQGAVIRAGLTDARSFAVTRFTGAHRPDDYGVEAGSASAPVWTSGWTWLAKGRAETPLRAGGWLVGLDDTSHAMSMYLYPAGAAGLLVLWMVISFVAVGRSAAADHHAASGGDRREPPSAAGYVAVIEDRIEDRRDTAATEITPLLEPAEDQIVALAAPPEEIPEFLDVMWDEPAVEPESKAGADHSRRGSSTATSSTAAGV